MAQSKRLTSPDDYTALIDKFETFLFDCDGVIWKGPHLVPGVKEVIAWLRSKGEFVRVNGGACRQHLTWHVVFRIQGKKVLFVSNNASKSRQMYKKTFDGFGIETTEVSTSSTYATT